MDRAFEYVFPAIRGIQAGREFYVSMCPLRLIPRMFLFNEAELVPELRAQRQLNKQRLPEIARYIADNRDSYVFSAITASIDADVEFRPSHDHTDVGALHVPMSAKFIINDGQHRRAAIEMAIAQCPDLADESISVVFFMDRGLQRCQQMFADLNRYAIRPSSSLNVLYDTRDAKGQLSKLVVDSLPDIKALINLEQSSLSAGSKQLFTLSALFNATSTLMDGHDFEDARDQTVIAFWQEVYNQMVEWQVVRSGGMTAGTFREQYLHGHAVVLHAIGRVGNSLLRTHGRGWKGKLAGLKDIDWRRSANGWEGRAMVGGTAQKSRTNVILTANLIKTRLGLALTAEEQRVEDALMRAVRAA
ncbi:DNA sulfur modification protein DndB [Caulobacter sp. CCNWLY153]|uniref:DNA sulfur modification protein DndB n=1 Tax=unclassified Caulobacter TaxID=2648921 RepID=UPI002FF27754